MRGAWASGVLVAAVLALGLLFVAVSTEPTSPWSLGLVPVVVFVTAFLLVQVGWRRPPVFRN